MSSKPTQTQSKRERMVLYVTAVVLLAALAIGGLLAFSAARSNQQAEEKADQLIAKLEEQGARTPTKDQIVRVLGDDGGAVCADPNAALNRAGLNAMLVNGASGPGIRPVIADSKVVQGELLILEVYCPDQLADFQQQVEDLKLSEDVAG